MGEERRLSYFQAADYILLTYAGSFHSQTSTLTTAVNARRLVLASSGASPMEDLVRKFGLGVYVEPDSSDAVADGMATLLHGKLPDPDWEGYEAHATWETNVIRLLQATLECLKGHSPQIRQFESLDESSIEAPELLNARRLHHQKTPTLKKRAAGAKKTAARKKASTGPVRVEPQTHEKGNGHIPDQPVFPGFDLSEPVETSSTPAAVDLPAKTANKRTAANSVPAKPVPRRRVKPAKKEALASH